MIADDHTFMAEACKKLLEPEFDVVATVGDGAHWCALSITAGIIKTSLWDGNIPG